VVNSLSGFGVV